MVFVIFIYLCRTQFKVTFNISAVGKVPADVLEQSICSNGFPQYYARLSLMSSYLCTIV